jgi:hypothetical protein
MVAADYAHLRRNTCVPLGGSSVPPRSTALDPQNPNSDDAAPVTALSATTDDQRGNLRRSPLVRSNCLGTLAASSDRSSKGSTLPHRMRIPTPPRGLARSPCLSHHLKSRSGMKTSTLETQRSASAARMPIPKSACRLIAAIRSRIRCAMHQIAAIKLATTRFVEPSSNAIVSLFPSTSVTVPSPNFSCLTRDPLRN